MTALSNVESWFQAIEKKTGDLIAEVTGETRRLAEEEVAVLKASHERLVQLAGELKTSVDEALKNVEPSAKAAALQAIETFTADLIKSLTTTAAAA